MFYTQRLNPIKRTSFNFLSLEINIRNRDKIITPNYEITNIFTLFPPNVQVAAI